MNTAVAQAPDSPLYVKGDEDDDSWLNLNAEDFDDLLQQSTGRATRDPGNDMDVDDSPEKAEERLAFDQAERLKEFASKVESFVEGEGDVDGARFEEYVSKSHDCVEY